MAVAGVAVVAAVEVGSGADFRLVVVVGLEGGREVVEGLVAAVVQGLVAAVVAVVAVSGVVALGGAVVIENRIRWPKVTGIDAEI